MTGPAQLLADLRPALRGRLFADAATRGVYATDASPFQVVPLAVVVPRDEGDVRTVVKYASENGLSVVPRGAGTGLAGESLGPGIVLDLSVHFRGIPVLDGDFVLVQPGLTLAELNAALATHGRRIAIDVSNPSSRTLGGLIATNASGSNAAIHGTMRDSVADLRVVWDDGDADDMSAATTGRGVAISIGLADLLRDHADTLRANPPRMRFDRCGYRLHDAIRGDSVDLCNVIVGSEGTLAVVTAATLRTTAIPGGTAATLLGFESLDDAAKAGVAVGRSTGVVSCDLLDRRLHSMGQGLVVPADVEAILIVTTERDSEREAVDAGRDAVKTSEAVARTAVLVEPTNAVGAIHAFRHSAVTGLYSLGSGPRPLAIVEDVAVPPDAVPEYLARIQSLVRARDLTASVFVYSPSGVVHVRPLVDLNVAADRDKLWPLADAVYAIALDLGGTVSGQHGVGIGRTPWVRTQSGPRADLFREVKRVFDPKNVFNPGKIVGPDPTRPAWPLRPVLEAIASTPAERKPLLLWSTPPEAEAAKCNGCGDCRPRPDAGRMCPVFRATGSETATPRAKANLFRLLDDPAIAVEPDAVKAVASKCVNCKMCRDECPAGVDVPRLMAEAKARHWRDHGTDRAGWFLARVEPLIGLASKFTFTTNALLGTRWGRWLLSRIVGLDTGIRLPAFRYRTFIWRAWAKGWTRRRKERGSGIGDRGSGPTDSKLALFVDPLTNATDPLTGEAAVAVLKHHGADVVVVSKARSTGLAALTAGDFETAREQARKAVRLLADYARDGYRIVCLDPSAAIAFRQELPWLLDDPDAKLVSSSTVELTALLGQWHDAGTLKTDFREQDLWLGHHVPCHVKALRGPVAGPRLLSLIPGIHVRTVDVGCSGMAGPWGALKRNRADSLAAGAAMTAALTGPDVLFGSSECGSCRIQMQDATGKRAVHPIQYLAMAYGLLPEVGRRLLVPLKDRVSR